MATDKTIGCEIIVPCELYTSSTYAEQNRVGFALLDRADFDLSVEPDLAGLEYITARRTTLNDKMSKAVRNAAKLGTTVLAGFKHPGKDGGMVIHKIEASCHNNEIHLRWDATVTGVA